ncbi:MAG TPA: Fic family protein [Solirubrobacterales bacterium]|jgi:Fic family protein
MGSYEEHLWPANLAGYGRATRRGGRYRTFVPAPISERSYLFDGDAGASLHEATKALGRLEHSARRVATLGAIAQNLLRSESVASSRIEGVVISQKRLARAAHEDKGRRRGDFRAAAVLGNVDAMKRAIDIGAASQSFAVSDLLDVHSRLLRFTEDRDIAGVIRKAQNWIGGNDYNPVGAAYVPPPPEHVPGLLEDLCRFIERNDLPPVAQAAIAHAQFETIHPFADGNGRAGRALIYAILRRRGEIAGYIPPISLVLGSTPRTYIGGLTAYRDGDVSDWCELFAGTTARAALEADGLAHEIEALQDDWLDRLGRPRRDSSASRLASALPEQPVIDVPAAQRLSGRSHVAVGAAMRQLEDAGILRRLNERKWGRVWECDELLELVEAFEKRVNSFEVAALDPRGTRIASA